jgi:MFS family permease
MHNPQAASGSARAALALAAGLALLHLPSGLPAPLYPVYQSTMGITSATVSMLFASYVAGVLVGLVLMPRIVGHRDVLVGACLLSIIGDLLFLFPRGQFELFAAHVAQGAVLGVFTSVVPVVLAEFDLSHTNRLVGRVTTSANAVGLAGGPLWSGLLLEYAPWPGKLVWVVQIVATLAVLPFMRIPPGLSDGDGRGTRLSGVLTSLGRGRAAKAALLAGFCAFGSGGLLVSLGAVVADGELGVHNGAVHGVLVSLCFVLSAIAGALHLRQADVRVVAYGLCWIVLGSAALVASVLVHSLLVMIIAAVLLGLGQGLGLQGATQMVAVRSAPAARGKAIAIFFILCYMGTTLASLGVSGIIVLTGLSTAFNGFSVLLVLLGVLGLLFSYQESRKALLVES